MTVQRNDDLLLERLADGEADAAQAVVRAYGGLVWSLALRFCRTRDDAEDAVQEILTDLWKSAHRYRSSRASERVFVTMIARRRLIDRLRRERRRSEVEPMASGPESDLSSPGDAGERGWDAEQAARAVQYLSEDQRRVLDMSMVQGMTQREISDATETPLGTVKTHMRRGLMRLRELMATESMATSGEVTQ
jgi:RNA polymerase sigma-70 factor (ECF subfamily)